MSRIPPLIRRAVRAGTVALGLLGCAEPANAWDLAGTKQVLLRTREGATILIGTVAFTPVDGIVRFDLALEGGAFTDFFLSMREFKCVAGPEVQCHVPYPYANPRTVTAGDLTWLEHSLIFFYKTPAQFGAMLGNGLYYAMRVTDDGIVGTPVGIDLHAIAAPPSDPDAAPYQPDERSEIDVAARWIQAILIR